ncbi:hypothetical protein [Streptomyces djakartensis]|uniref:hypothetical protein n=1 Tax=Streptomyces djakartensis TaxID=68193 RepID=UPI0034DFB518
MLIGFDGPVDRLFSATTARDSVAGLLTLVAGAESPSTSTRGTPRPGPDRRRSTARELREAGCETAVTSLSPLLEAARSL